MNKAVELTKELQRVMYSTTYSFEIDTEDVVFGFKKTLKKRTKSLVKALQLERKLRSDVGRYILYILIEKCTTTPIEKCTT